MATEPTPQQKFLYIFNREGIALPDTIKSPTPPQMMIELTKLVVPLEEQKMVALGLTLLNGPYRTFLTAEDVTLLNDKLVAVLYEMMSHPPRNLASQDFRTADGADKLGAARMPYALSVLTNAMTFTKPDGKPTTTTWKRVTNNGKEEEYKLPDAKDVFDKLMLRVQTTDGDGKRTEKVVDNPDGLSALTFAYGTLVVHSVFRSRLTDHEFNDTSSFFDLSPLYGDNLEQQLSVRNRNGQGLLAPDCFADDRMLSLPPAAAAVLVLFNRNHNYIAKELLKKEKNIPGEHFNNAKPKRDWTDDTQLLQWDTVKRNKQDDEIFELARLVNCVHFVNIVATDYVGGIMGRTKAGGGWPYNAKVFDKIDLPDRAVTYMGDQSKFQKASHVSRGDGNLVSTEFNTLYRWHSTLSKADVTWVEGMISAVLRTTEFDKITSDDYVRAIRMAEPFNPDPKQRGFARLQRCPDSHQLDDDELAKIILNATEAPAGAFRAQGSPLVMGFIDIIGIERARAMNTSTLNEFRVQQLRLPRYATFDEWNGDPVISAAASKLYDGEIDRLELYPGLQAEGAQNDGFDIDYDPLRVSTMRNGLLLDAVALIRGDRFFTTAFNAGNYTQTGFDDVQIDTTNKAYGGCMNKLLRRTLPRQFPEDSVYTWFPMTTPGEMKKALGENTKGLVFTRPGAAK